MRFAILKAGSAHRGARERLGDFSGMFTALLARPGQTWDVHDVAHGQFPARVEAYSGFVITGSRASAYDGDPWVARLLHVIRAIHARRIPLLGVCFGHQAVAQALGGRVAPHPQGWDVGMQALALTPAGAATPLLRDAPRPLAVFELHGDAVLAPPEGAVRLAGSGHTEWEMFALGAATLCVQGHPEFDAEVIREAAARLGGAGTLPPGVVERALASLATPVPQGFWGERLGDFLAGGAPSAAAAGA